MPPSATGLIHIWNRCHNCGAAPIVGLRFTCQTCPAGAHNDLCEACYRLFEQGRIEHPSPEAREAPPGRHLFSAFEGVDREQALRWIDVEWSSAPTPKVPDRFIVRPEFRSGRESFFGSYGFVIAQDGGGLLMLTALHVLDELAKFRGIDCSEQNRAYTGRELPQQVTGVMLYDPFASNWMLAEIGMAGGMLALPEARICGNEPHSQDDLAAFHVDRPNSLQPLRLAAKAPRVGDPIWLAANRGRGVPGRTIQAVVVETTPETLVFRFEPRVAMPPYTSGAPLLSRSGEVVAVNSGGGVLDGYNFGHACHASSIRRHLGW